MATLVDDLVPDELWALVASLLPAPRRPPYGGRRRAIPDRSCFAAIVYMARTSTPWRLLPAPGAWLWLTGDRLASPDRVGHRGRIRSAAPGGVGPARRAGPAGLVAGERGNHERARQAWGGPGGRKSRRSWQARSKLHLVCDGGGLPLTAAVTAANVNDTIMFQAVLEDVPPIRTPSGRRRTRPGKVHADKAYDSGANRAYLRRRGIRPRIARRGVESSVRLGRHRWRIERALSWLSCFRRVQVRWDRDAGRWFGFVLVACAVVCFNRL
jgi:transposase